MLAINKLDLSLPKYKNFKSIYLQPLQPCRLKNYLSEKQSGNDTKIHSVKLNDFDVVKCLGCGGFSTVFLARGNFNNKYYAMKVIDKKFIVES